MQKLIKHRTDFLSGASGILVGIGSVFNLAGDYFMFNFSKTGFDADKKAIASDWGMVGNDIESSMFQLTSTIDENQLELDFYE